MPRSAKGVLDVINRAGAEAFRISIGAIPMLVLSLVVVHGLRSVGAIDGLTRLLSPLLGFPRHRPDDRPAGADQGTSPAARR
jgi:spore maturation protein SpmB